MPAARVIALTRMCRFDCAMTVLPAFAWVVSVHLPAPRCTLQENLRFVLLVVILHLVVIRAVARAPRAIWAICELPPVAICTTRVAPAGTGPVVMHVVPVHTGPRMESAVAAVPIGGGETTRVSVAGVDDGFAGVSGPGADGVAAALGTEADENASYRIAVSVNV